MKRLFAIALLFAGLAARAQETPTVTARVEPDSIMIGDRFDYVIDVEKDLVQVVEFPVFDPRDGKIELVENCPVDTLERDGRRLKLRKRYRLAAFDEGKYNLGAAQVLYADKNILDTLRSTDSVYLEVATFQIDYHVAVDLRPESPEKPAVPLPRGERLRQVGRFLPPDAARGGLCAQALPRQPRQGFRRPVQTRSAAPAARGGHPGPRSAPQPETMAEQQA